MSFGGSHLAGLRAVWVERDLLGCQLPARVHVVAEVDPPEGALAQQLAPPPRERGTRGCRGQMKNGGNGGS